MVIYKFGGASVRNAESLRLLGNVVQGCTEQVIIVVSAMGKTTNHLEEIVKLAGKRSEGYAEKIALLQKYHREITEELIPDALDPVHDEISRLFVQIAGQVERFRDQDFGSAAPGSP